MLIDWFTVIAQIINFLILVALLKHFLYRPILKAMDDREEKIRLRLEEAEQKKRAAEYESISFQKKNRALEEKRQEMLYRAKQEAESRRKELIQQARDDVDSLHGRWREAIQKEKESFLRDLRQHAGRQVYTVARRALKDMANADLEAHTIDVFLDHITKMEEKDKKSMAEAIKAAGNGVTVLSALEILPTMRQKIINTLQDHILQGMNIEYATSPELILGIELTTRGRKLAWSLDDYLKTLEERAREALDREVRKGQEET